jgi:hypothetical protein
MKTATSGLSRSATKCYLLEACNRSHAVPGIRLPKFSCDPCGSGSTDRHVEEELKRATPAERSYAAPQPVSFSVFEKAESYQAKVAERLRRATRALAQAKIPYAVVGGNAVMAWIVQADASALRPTQDVDLLLQRESFPDARIALEKAGFVFRHAASLDMFLDGPDGNPREALHIVFAGMKVRPHYAVPAPELSEAVPSPDGFLVLDLPALVRMKLTSFRLKDQVHLQDLAGVGLLDPAWMRQLPDPLAERLKFILENPEA